ncbi:peptidyl-prolyl cis-trans isomerase cyclophilin-type family protein [Reticulomyxa filosa]|uniref:Peptidyl-prolyl cis-trans isomerase cyclophilin-type family protein n=1 Tax=Reticulomyxa filosa TaxID=46433 RepID=X6MN23_RETFI|nr:peptidyl-prolyl cis-trans isomerase cyclophilin-type family protein [Reticulomyxa filosa]|eukprot:ETO15269.1 peptidyl-prolyl cis-trans isomerase cyclophilin-type family protein [Reticulomyxa filosa]
MEGYYEGCMFHRVIPKFMAQAGDPTNTGRGGESIYDNKPFKDEFHARLTFSHRGIMACANDGESPNSNQSQFFITLDRCEWLNRKHTIFGKVTGNTIFNLLKFNDLEIDTTSNAEDGEQSRPLQPPKIVSCEILLNPFDDIVPRTLPKHIQMQQKQKELQLKEQKERREVAIKDSNLLSFGEEESGHVIQKKKKKRTIDDKNDEKIGDSDALCEYEAKIAQQQQLFGQSKQPVSVEQIRAKLKQYSSNNTDLKPVQSGPTDNTTQKRQQDKEDDNDDINDNNNNNNDNNNDDDDDDGDLDAKIKAQIIKEHSQKRKRKEMETKDKGNETNKENEKSKSDDDDNMAPAKKKARLDSEYESLKKKLLEKQSGVASGASEMDDSKQLTTMRDRHFQRNVRMSKKEKAEYTTSKLDEFLKKLNSTSASSVDKHDSVQKTDGDNLFALKDTNGPKVDTNTGIKFKDDLYGEDDDDVDGLDWMDKPLIFPKRPQDYSLFNAEEYMTLDPSRKEDQVKLKEKEDKIQQLFEFRKSLEEKDQILDKNSHRRRERKEYTSKKKHQD